MLILSQDDTKNQNRVIELSDLKSRSFLFAKYRVKRQKENENFRRVLGLALTSFFGTKKRVCIYIPVACPTLKLNIVLKCIIIVLRTFYRGEKMRLNEEKEQLLLAVAHALQNNFSNAASTPKWRMEKLIKDKVHVRYCYEKRNHIYSLQPTVEEKTEVAVKSARIVSKGRTPISDDLIAEIKKMRLEGHTVRFIAKDLKVGRGTVEKYMK